MICTANTIAGLLASKQEGASQLKAGSPQAHGGEDRKTNSPPCFFDFSFSFFDLSSSRVLIPKFKLSSEKKQKYE